ncbi:MAG: CNNM domain-containing protein [Verrucomicrobiota bacterium]
MALLLILTCLLTGVISFLCSLTEAVLLSLNPLALQLQSSRGERNAARWLELRQRIERPISAILVLNTSANTGLATLSGAIFAYLYGAHWLWLFTLVLTVSIIFAGELAPKIIGVHHTDRMAPKLIGPLSGLVRIMHPVVVLMDRFCRIFKSGKPSPSRASERIMDIVTLVEAARAEQVLHNREEIIIIHAATLSARRVRGAMVPRSSVAFFDSRLSLVENVRSQGLKTHRSYPVSGDGSPDKITGYIRVRELFVSNLLASPAGGPVPDWREHLRPVLHIDERATLTQLLALFLDHGEIAALVDNSAGEVSGWITMDDVMKVLMGERI